MCKINKSVNSAIFDWGLATSKKQERLIYAIKIKVVVTVLRSMNKIGLLKVIAERIY